MHHGPTRASRRCRFRRSGSPAVSRAVVSHRYSVVGDKTQNLGFWIFVGESQTGNREPDALEVGDSPKRPAPPCWRAAPPRKGRKTAYREPRTGNRKTGRSPTPSSPGASSMAAPAAALQASWVMRRPLRFTQASFFVGRDHFQQPLQPSRCLVDRLGQVSDIGVAILEGHQVHGSVVDRSELLPTER